MNNKSKKPKLLFLVQLPPPIHGASLRNKSIVESKKINENFNIKVIPLNFTKDINNLSKFSIIKVFKSFLILFKLKKELILSKPNLVFWTFSPNGFAFIRDFMYAITLKVFGVNKIFLLRERIIKNKVKIKLYNIVFKNSELIILSDFIKKELSFVKNCRMHTIYDGIEEVITNDQLAKKSVNKTPVILFLSNLITHKGIYVFLDSLKILKDNGLEFKANIVGAPVDVSEKMLFERIKELNLNDNVKYHGFIEGNIRYGFYLNSDIFVLPTLRDSFPGVVLEAMQSGLPVVSTKEGGIPEMVINGETGFLVEKNNSEVIANKIEYLINNKDKILKLGAAGRKRFEENFTYEIMEKNLLSLFLQKAK